MAILALMRLIVSRCIYGASVDTGNCSDLQRHQVGGNKRCFPTLAGLRVMINKIVQTMAEALQGIRDGAVVLVGGFGSIGQPLH